MKLLKTITKIVTEAEDNYYNVSLKSTDSKELEIMEYNLNESLRLFKIYNDIKIRTKSSFLLIRFKPLNTNVLIL